MPGVDLYVVAVGYHPFNVIWAEFGKEKVFGLKSGISGVHWILTQKFHILPRQAI